MRSPATTISVAADHRFQSNADGNLEVLVSGDVVATVPSVPSDGLDLRAVDGNVTVTQAGFDSSGLATRDFANPNDATNSATVGTDLVSGGDVSIQPGNDTSEAPGRGGGGGTGGGDGTGISLPTGQGEVTETATDEAETFTLDLQAAATGDNTQIILEGFSAQEDTLQFDFDNQFIPSVQVDSLDDLDDVAVNTGGDQADVSSNPITNQTTVTLGMDGSGDAIALTLAGITEQASVEAEVV